MNKDQLKEMIKGYLTDILNEKAQKPDFPDVDGDGDRTEPISKASKEKKGNASDDDKPKKKAKKGEIPPQLRDHVKGKQDKKEDKEQVDEAESTNIDEYSNHPFDKFAEKTVAPAMRAGANTAMGVVRGITGAVKGLGQGLRGDEDEVEEGVLRDLGNAVVDGAKGVYGAGEDVVDAFGSFKKTPSIAGALKGAVTGAAKGAKKGFDTFKHRDKDGNLKEEELEEGGKALRTGNEDRFSGNEDKFSTDRVHEVEDVDEAHYPGHKEDKKKMKDVDEAHYPGHKEDKKKMKESDEIEEGSCGSYSRDDEVTEDLENIQTPEQEYALYEARFSNRNEKLFKKLLGKWAK